MFRIITTSQEDGSDGRAIPRPLTKHLVRRLVDEPLQVQSASGSARRSFRSKSA